VVPGEHRRAGRRSDGPTVRVTPLAKTRGALPHGRRDSGRALPRDIQLRRPARARDRIPPVVRVGAEGEVGRRGAERFVATVPDHELGCYLTRADAAVSCPNTKLVVDCCP
jgi:hypothetical protein